MLDKFQFIENTKPEKDKYHGEIMKRSIKIWIISMLVTLIVYLVSWIIVEANVNGYIVITTCIALSVINAAYGIIQACLNFKKNLHRFLMICIMPSTIYFLYAMLLTYILFFTEFKIDLSF